MTQDRLALLGGAPTLDHRQHRLWPIVGDLERAAIARVLERGVLSGATAPETVAFEHEFAQFVGSKHALLTHSGTSALHLAVAALGLGVGDHVIIPAYSFVATPLAVLHAGAIPIFADVNPRTGLLDLSSVEAHLTPRTRAIMPVHVHGCACDLDALNSLAARHHLSIIEDAAQAHGAMWREKPVGPLGAAGGFSLQSSKNLSAGEGGVLVTNDSTLAEAAYRIRGFGQNMHLTERGSFDPIRPLDATRALDSERVGWMYRGNELGAAFARAALAQLAERTAACRANANLLIHALRELPGVLAPEVPDGATSVFHKFRVGFDLPQAGLDMEPLVFRELLTRALQAEGLEVVLWQVAPLSAQPLFQRRDGFGHGWPWSADRETHFAEWYAPTRFPQTQRLLDTSIILFSQSRPLIAQSREVVLKYAEAFQRVWERRHELVAVARRGTE